MEQSYHEQLIEQRRHLHQYPEVGWTEFETTWFITQRLQKWGYKVYLGHQVIDKDSIRGRNENWVKEAIDRAKAHQVPEDFLLKTDELTGCVGVLDTGREGPVIALRFDIDALPVQETDAPEHFPNQMSRADDFAPVCPSKGLRSNGATFSMHVREPASFMARRSTPTFGRAA